MSASAATLQPISRAKASDLVAEQIKSRIIDGTWKPGDKIPSERELAEQLMVSRAPVREALRMLEAMGWLQIRPGESTRVCDGHFSAHEGTMSDVMFKRSVELGEIWEARKLIEPRAAYLAAERGDATDIAALEQIIQRMEALVEEGLFYDAFRLNPDFHRAIAKASGNKVVLRFSDLLGQLQHRWLADLHASDVTLARAIQTNQEHRLVFEAIKAGTPQEAEDAVFAHLVDSWMARLVERNGLSPREERTVVEGG